MRPGSDALILAAGSGGRMGGPKARLLVDGVPLVLRHVRRAREAGCERVLVVARPEDLDWLATEGVEAVASRAPDQAGSLAVGVRALRDVRDHVLVTPVDTLPASCATITSLRGRICDSIDAVSPRFEGRGGHPLIVRSRVLDPYREGLSPTLRELLATLGIRRIRLPVDDPATALDLDLPEDVVRLTGAVPRFICPGSGERREDRAPDLATESLKVASR